MQHAAFKCCWDNISIATIRLQTHKQISVVTCAAVHAPNTKSAAAEVLKPRYFKMSMLKKVHVFFSNVPEKHHQMSLTSMILSCLCSIIRTYWRLIFFIRMLEFEKYHNYVVYDLLNERTHATNTMKYTKNIIYGSLLG
jgi:hypothetical protein